jgi:hypothetical protein
MLNDAVWILLFIICLPKTGSTGEKSSRSWPGENAADHGHYTHGAVSEAHDLSPPRCPPFLEAGTQDLLWLYKSQRKA